MSRIDDAIATLSEIKDGTHRALEMAGLVSTLFKIRGVMLIVTGQLAFHSYADTAADHPEVELSPLSGKLTPRLMQEIMAGQLHAKGMIDRWVLAGIPIRFGGQLVGTNRDLCRDFITEYGVAHLIPAEEITAARVLAAYCPEMNDTAYDEARLLLINAMTHAFPMDWTVLRDLCHSPEYRVGEQLASLRGEAKQDADSIFLATGRESEIVPDPVDVAPVIPPPPVERKPSNITASQSLSRRLSDDISSLGM